MNDIYNLNNFTKFRIDKKLLQNNITKNIEDYVKNIMITDFIHVNHDIQNNYLTSNDKIDIKYDNNYTLIFDNMQCNLKNISLR